MSLSDLDRCLAELLLMTLINANLARLPSTWFFIISYVLLYRIEFYIRNSFKLPKTIRKLHILFVHFYLTIVLSLIFFCCVTNNTSIYKTFNLSVYKTVSFLNI